MRTRDFWTVGNGGEERPKVMGRNVVENEGKEIKGSKSMEGFDSQCKDFVLESSKGKVLSRSFLMIFYNFYYFTFVQWWHIAGLTGGHREEMQ